MPLQRITRAVSVQMTMVSINTSMIPISPCWAGWETWADAWAIDAVPMPASFVKMPLEDPTRTAVSIDPTTPPVIAPGENAPRRMLRKASAIR